MTDLDPQGAFERSRAEPERSTVAYARCKRQPRDVYTSVYIGTQRPPRHPDERGAVAVIECVFGGRVRVYAIAGDPDHRRVEHDREWRPAP